MKQLAIQITDEDDPFFILNLLLGEDEYRRLLDLFSANIN